MVFDDEFSTVPFMREGTIPLNWTDLVQHSSEIGAPEDIDPKDTWLYPDIEEGSREYHPRQPSTYINLTGYTPMRIG